MMGTFLAVTPLMLGLIVGGGFHAWIATGYVATHDPAEGDFEVTGLRVVGPLWPRYPQDRWYDLRPGSWVDRRLIRRVMRPVRDGSYDAPWEGGYVSVAPGGDDQEGVGARVGQEVGGPGGGKRADTGRLRGEQEMAGQMHRGLEEEMRAALAGVVDLLRLHDDDLGALDLLRQLRGLKTEELVEAEVTKEDLLEIRGQGLDALGHPGPHRFAAAARGRAPAALIQMES